MKIIELIINELEDIMGIEAISLVENPAIESNFISLAKQKGIHLEKREIKLKRKGKTLLGAALIPNKPIYRKDDVNGEYYIYFSKNTVLKALKLYMKRLKLQEATQEHEKKIGGTYVFEAWIKEDMVHDKSALYGLDDPIGTMMVKMEVENEQVAKDIEEGLVKGFSIEAYFADRYEAPQESGVEDKLSEIIKILEG